MISDRRLNFSAHSLFHEKISERLMALFLSAENQGGYGIHLNSMNMICRYRGY